LTSAGIGFAYRLFTTSFKLSFAPKNLNICLQLEEQAYCTKARANKVPGPQVVDTIAARFGFTVGKTEDNDNRKLSYYEKDGLGMGILQ
jgi:hypothetical protein